MKLKNGATPAEIRQAALDYGRRGELPLDEEGSIACYAGSPDGPLVYRAMYKSDIELTIIGLLENVVLCMDYDFGGGSWHHQAFANIPERSFRAQEETDVVVKVAQTIPPRAHRGPIREDFDLLDEVDMRSLDPRTDAC